MAEILSEQFLSVFIEPTDEFVSKDKLFHNQNSELEDLVLNDEAFIDALSELFPQAAAGPNGMPSILVQKCKEEYAHTLKILWKKSFDSEMTLTSLKQPYVVSIFKGG